MNWYLAPKNHYRKVAWQLHLQHLLSWLNIKKGKNIATPKSAVKNKQLFCLFFSENLKLWHNYFYTFVQNVKLVVSIFQQKVHFTLNKLTPDMREWSASHLLCTNSSWISFVYNIWQKKQISFMPRGPSGQAILNKILICQGFV